MSANPTTSAAVLGDAALKDLATRYLAVRRTTEHICSPLSPEDQMVQSTLEASPAKWHRAHTTWFFETFLLTPHLPGYQPYDPYYRYLFNSYYNAVGEKPERTLRGFFSRPSAEQVAEYREHVDQAMLRLLERLGNPDLPALIELGLNHEQQHQELIVTDVKHAFWTNPTRPAYWEQPGQPKPPARSARLRWSEYEHGLREVGHPGKGFAFDNEGPRHAVYLEPFRLASRLVTTAEFLEFMEDGGYSRPEFWLSDGWDTLRLNGWKAPLYWEQRDGRWWCFTASGMREVAPDEPVCHVSHYEADAYARWRGARLPREAEWEVAAAEAPVEGNFLEDGRLHPAPAHSDRPLPQQIFGDLWEWTSSSYSPYPGYKPVAGALGEYNAKFMSNQMVLRGGSCATPRSHIRATYRNFFAPQMRWQFMGIRLADDGE